MESISTSMDFNGGEEAKLPTITENSAGEAEQEANLETTITAGNSYSIYLTREKRRRDSDSSTDDDLDFLGDNDDKEQEDNMGKKRLMTEEEKCSSHQEWYESQLEDNKQNILKEMKEKENKLLMMKWSQKRKESCVTLTSMERLKEELALLQIMYEQLVI